MEEILSTIVARVNDVLWNKQLLLLFLLFYLSRQKADEELLIAIGLLLIL